MYRPRKHPQLTLRATEHDSKLAVVARGGISSGRYLSASDVTPEEIERFWKKVRKTNNCYLWTGATSKAGQIFFALKGVSCSARRIAFALGAGEILAGTAIRSNCGKTNCVRFEHLIAGTASEIRMARIKTIIEQPNASPRQVRDLYAAGVRTTEIAAETGLYPRTVANIARNRNYHDPSYIPRSRYLTMLALSTEQMEEARRLWTPGKRGAGSVKQLAIRFGVAYSTMHYALHGNTPSYRNLSETKGA